MARHFKAIAAMAHNRVIGRDNQLPWHLPEELKWFKQMTIHQVVIMGRRTYESIGRPLPQRETIVISRAGTTFPGTRTVRSLSQIRFQDDPREFFIIGGAQIFAEGLPLCSHLYLTTVHREVEGDVFFPPFEHLFVPAGVVKEHPDFTIQLFRNKTMPGNSSDE